MVEVWKEIEGYSGDYEISNFGRVRSNKAGKSKILKQHKKTGGYLYVVLCKNNIAKPYRVNRLVAIAFVDNPNNYPYVNHKDSVRTNNFSENLEWCTAKYNSNYGKTRENISNGKKRPVAQIDIRTGKVLNVFPGSIDACKFLGIKNSTNINKCCNGKIKQSHGYKWARVDSGALAGVAHSVEEAVGIVFGGEQDRMDKR